MPPPAKSRRAEYAEATRQAIVDAARLLFAQQGYFATTVEEIAKEARVAPATVYAVAGGKQGLMRTLVDVWSTDPVVAESLAAQKALTDPGEILRHAAATVRAMREKYGDIVRMVLVTAPHNPDVQEALDVATKRYRAAVAAVIAQLAAAGGLPARTDRGKAAEVLWFYFGYSGLFTLVDENGWSYERAERWLVEQAAAALGLKGFS